jgi:hypothetical protein
MTQIADSHAPTDPRLKTRWVLFGDTWHFYVAGDREPVCGQGRVRTMGMVSSGAPTNYWRCRPCRSIVAELRHIDAEMIETEWCVDPDCSHRAVLHIHDALSVPA